MFCINLPCLYEPCLSSVTPQNDILLSTLCESLAGRGKIEHNISLVAQSRRTKEEVLLEAVQHFSGDFQEASRRKGDWLAASPVFVYSTLATVYSGKNIRTAVYMFAVACSDYLQNRWGERTNTTN